MPGPEPSKHWRLMPAVAVTAAVTLVLAGLVMAYYNERSYEQQKIKEVGVQAEILASSVSAALAFSDRNAAQEYLSALAADPELLAAAVYASDGALFASYSRDRAHQLQAAPPQIAVFEHGQVAVARPRMTRPSSRHRLSARHHRAVRTQAGALCRDRASDHHGRAVGDRARGGPCRPQQGQSSAERPRHSPRGGQSPAASADRAAEEAEEALRPEPEDGGAWPADRRHRARLQQHADGRGRRARPADKGSRREAEVLCRQCVAAAERGARLTAQLLAFARSAAGARSRMSRR